MNMEYRKPPMKTTDRACLFDQIINDPNYKGGALWLSCPCPKCTPQF